MSYPPQGPGSGYPGSGAPQQLQQPPQPWTGYPQQPPAPQHQLAGYGPQQLPTAPTQFGGYWPQQQPNFGQQPPGPTPYGFNPALPPKKRNTAIWIGALVGILVIAAAAVGIVVATSHSGKSDEDQITAAVNDWADTMNTQGFEASIAKQCSMVRSSWDTTPSDQKAMLRRAKFTVTVYGVSNINVTGDSARASLKVKILATVGGVQKQAPHDDIANVFKKEDGAWKLCADSNLMK